MSYDLFEQWKIYKKLKKNTQEILKDTEYDLVLTYADPKHKFSILKIVRNTADLTNAQAKVFISHLPQILKKKLNKTQVCRLRRKIWAVNSDCDIVESG
jgi:ribosomal protein L7/L12